MADEAADPFAKLRRIVAAFPGQGFAVLDGARFADLPRLCRGERLFARSLFLDHADAEVEKAGPWLLGLGQAPDALDKVLALVGEEPAAVFWCCAGGEAVLHRHLRTLNMVRIPAWAVAGGASPPADGSGLEPRPVMFRHWDPRVLGALMPVLDGAQFARVLGPAAEIAFLAVDHGGARRVLADPALPAAPSGLLLIRSDQIAAVSERRASVSRLRRMAYLRSVASEDTRSKSDAELSRDLDACEGSAARLGLRTERSQAQWAYLMISTQGAIERAPAVRRYLLSGPGEPHDKMQIMLDRMVRLSELDQE